MVRSQLLWRFTRFSATLLVPVILVSNLLSEVQAQPPAKQLLARRLTFEPPKNQPAPKATTGGGRRDDGRCPLDRVAFSQSAEKPTTRTPDQVLTPLAPTTNVGLTIAAHPTFLVYVPKTTAKSIEFSLEELDPEEEERGVYQTTVNLTGSPGVIGITLPTSVPPLEIGRDYRWVVSMVCQPADPKDPFAEGLVRRFQPDNLLVRQLNGAKPIDQVALYAQSGIWYEAASNLIALRRSQPNNSELASAWKDLLESVGFGAIAAAPVKN